MRPSVKKLLLFGSVAPYSGALLALDFVGSRTNGQPYYMLNGATYPRVNNIPGWTYTGGTAAGTGSYAAKADGSLQFFPSYTNLLLQSQTFDNATWAKSAVTVTANQIAAPDGTTTADLIQADGTSSVKVLTIAASALNASKVASVYVKAGTASLLQIYFNGDAAPWANFNLSTGTVGSIGSGITAAIEPLANGWYRVSVVYSSASATDVRLSLISSAAAGRNETNTLATNLYLWGAQLELGSTASTYIPTTTAAVTVGTPRITDAGYWAEEARTNLLLRSQEFDNASWTKANTTVSANSIAAPDGTLTADKLQEDAATSGHSIYQAATVTTATTYTHTYYLKAGERGYAAIYDGNVSKGKYFDLINGAVLGNLTGAPDSATITSAGNGWWRCSITVTSVGTTSTPIVYVSTNGSSYTYTGTAGSGIYIWQADLQAGSFATSPIPTTSVAVTRAADVGYVSGLVVPSAYTLMSQGTVSAQKSGFPQMFSLDSGNVTDDAQIYFNAGAPQKLWGLVRVAGATQASLDLSTANNLTGYSAAMRVAANDFAATKNGATPTTDATGTVPTTTIMRVGVGPFANNWNGPIRRVVIYPRAFGNSELQAITTAGAY